MSATEIHDEVFRIVHSADSDTDDLIKELVEWATGRVEHAYDRGFTLGFASGSALKGCAS